LRWRVKLGRVELFQTHRHRIGGTSIFNSLQNLQISRFFHEAMLGQLSPDNRTILCSLQPANTCLPMPWVFVRRCRLKKTTGDGGGEITAGSLSGGPPATGSRARAVKSPECGAEDAAAGDDGGDRSRCYRRRLRHRTCCR
jgi:hypothetical protein